MSAEDNNASQSDIESFCIQVPKVILLVEGIMHMGRANLLDALGKLYLLHYSIPKERPIRAPSTINYVVDGNATQRLIIRYMAM